MKVFLEGHTSKQVEDRMVHLAGQAFHCWKQEGHPGWSLDDRDSSMLDEMHHRDVCNQHLSKQRFAANCSSVTLIIVKLVLVAPYALCAIAVLQDICPFDLQGQKHSPMESCTCIISRFATCKCKGTP